MVNTELLEQIENLEKELQEKKEIIDELESLIENIKYYTDKY